MSLILNNCQFSVNQIHYSVTLELKPGETKGVYGPSGSGKSTFLHLLAGAEGKSFNSGDYSLDGRPFESLSISERTKKISLMFQNPDAQFCMSTVKEELLFCLENVQTPSEEMEGRVTDALTFCGIMHLSNQQLVTLSGGEKQLVALACCIVLESQYLLLDEPFANLDDETTQSILSKLNQLQQLKHVGILIIDHEVDLVGDWVGEWLLINDSFLPVSSKTLLDQERKAKKQLWNRSFIKPISRTTSTEVLRLEQFTLKIRNYQLTLSERFYQGEIIGLTGRSGLGKSTLLKAILQYVPYQGHIYLNNKRLSRFQNSFQQISWIMQNPQDQLLETSVEKEMALGRHLAYKDIEARLKELKLWQQRAMSPFLLSQGQQRRLAVACIIARDVPVLLVDEPTYGQDYRQAWRLMNLLSEKARQGALVIIVSHDTALLEQTCHRIINLNPYAKEDLNETAQSNSQVHHIIRHCVNRFFSN